MHFFKHVTACTLVGAGVSVLAGTINEPHLAMLFAGGVLIDLDHVVYFLWRYGLNFKKIKCISGECYRNSDAQFYIFHTFEAAFLFWYLAHIYPQFQYFWIGYLLHLGMDIYVYLKKRKNRTWIKKWMAGYQVIKVAKSKLAANISES